MAKAVYTKSAKHGLRLVSVSFVLVILTYYVVLLAHLKNPLIAAAQEGLFGAAGLPLLYVYGFATIITLTVKGGFVFRAFETSDRSRAIRTVIFVTILALAFQGLFVLALLFGHYGGRILGSEYFKEMRTFWIAIGLAVGMWGLSPSIRRARLVHWETLKNLRGVPFASPVFCFGIPALIATNLTPLPLSPSDKVTYIAFSLPAGLIYAAFIVFVALNEHRVVNAEREAKRIILTGNGSREESREHEHYVERVTRIGFVMFASATYLLTLAFLDVTMAVATAVAAQSN